MSHVAAVRTAYDTVAAAYADRYGDALADLPLSRAMLAAFAELVRGGGGPVADLGCGPGHVTAHLGALGVPAFGLDLSPAMVRLARRAYPHLGFQAGSLTALPLADGVLGGILSWWSIVHTPPELLPVVFAEFRRALAPGGHLLLGFHVGDGHRRLERPYGHDVVLDKYYFPPDRIADLLAEAGLVVVARLVEEPDAGQRCQSATLLARRGESDG